jgi:hypothetical protein
MIIFNELKYAEKLLKHGFVNFMSSIDLVMLVRYLRYIGKNEVQIAEDVDNFCRKYNSAYNEVSYADKIKFVLKIAQRRNLIIPSPVPITQKEIDTIKSVKDYKAEKVLFFLLVLAKHSKLNVGIKRYYANAKWTEIFTTAKVHVDLDEQYRILNLLGQKTKLISMKLSGTNKLSSFLITFIDEQSEPIFYIGDFENITSFYPHYCSVCGKQIIKIGNNHNMCGECWKIRERELWRENKRKIRNIL